MKPCLKDFYSEQDYREAEAAYWRGYKTVDTILDFLQAREEDFIFDISLTLKDNVEEIMMDSFWFKRGVEARNSEFASTLREYCVQNIFNEDGFNQEYLDDLANPWR